MGYWTYSRKESGNVLPFSARMIEKFQNERMNEKTAEYGFSIKSSGFPNFEWPVSKRVFELPTGTMLEKTN